jgi:hypothetical protein
MILVGMRDSASALRVGCTGTASVCRVSTTLTTTAPVSA